MHSARRVRRDIGRRKQREGRQPKPAPFRARYALVDITGNSNKFSCSREIDGCLPLQAVFRASRAGSMTSDDRTTGIPLD
jgi:hypothetical protein